MRGRTGERTGGERRGTEQHGEGRILSVAQQGGGGRGREGTGGDGRGRGGGEEARIKGRTGEKKGHRTTGGKGGYYR